MKIPARLLFVFIFSALLLLTSYFLLPTSVNAQELPRINPPPPNTNPEVPNNLHNWTQTVMIEVASALSCQISGIDPTNPKGTCLGADPKTGKIGFLPKGDLEKGEIGGAIGGMNNLIASLYTPPLRTGDYFQYLAQNFGISKIAYAQTGTGFEGLKPLLRVWEGFRNIVYLFFVLVFVVIGLAIMLRVKIDPRTVMSIQNQIPKIIIGILLVTFSYAIAGFLIDMMYVSTHVIGNLIVDSAGLDKSLPTQLSQKTNPFSAAAEVGAGGGNAYGGMWRLIEEPSLAISEVLANFYDPFLNSFSTFVSKVVVGVALPGAGEGGTWWNPLNWITNIENVATNAVADILFKMLHVVLGTFVGFLAFIIISIALLIALFRLWFTLLFAYVHILIDVILAPFWIIGGLIPGSPINVGGWFRDLIANLAAFPAVIAMFLLGKVFMAAFGGFPENTLFVPPLIGARANEDHIGALIGLGIILMTPNVVNMLKAMLKAPKVETGSAFAPVGGAIGIGRETVGTIVAYKSKLPSPTKAEGIQGVLKRMFR
ncbi:MAG: hypothetical protein HYT07_03595 [Candidatus Levybacteria bacterium]|nr:hypothetical protein [Candidatus Levybacteria bacterium]